MADGNGELNPREALAALGIAQVDAVERVEGGSDSAIWRVEAAGGVYALRVFRPGEQDDCDRERTAMWAASAAGLPVPAVHATGSWRERPALLLDWLPGLPVFEELRQRPERAAHLGAVFGEMQARLHTVAAPPSLAARPDEWIDWLGSDQPALAERLRASAYPGGALLHFDYHPLNALTDGERITGLLDWRNVCAGPPRADAARTHAILWIDAPQHASPRARAILEIFAHGWQAGYQRHGGSLDDMAPFYAWAGATMLRDLANKRPPDDLARIRAWTDSWLAEL